MIKVKYDSVSTLVEGYYLDSIKYKVIPEPFIEIEDADQIANKTMCVVDGIYQLYITPENIRADSLRDSKILICKMYLDNSDWKLVRELDKPGSYKDIDKLTRHLARKAIKDLKKLTTLKEVEEYNTSKFTKN